MNGIARNALRFKNLVVAAPAKLKNTNGTALFSTLQQKSLVSQAASSSVVLQTKSHGHPCACVSCRFNHSKAEKELGEFLAEEIVAEKKALIVKTIPTEVEGFTVSLDGADVQLVKTTNDEKITILFNVNDSVDAEDIDEDVVDQKNTAETGVMKSKPPFQIDIKKGNQTLSFTCSFNSDNVEPKGAEDYHDLFTIDELAIYEGEDSEKTFRVAGEVIDGYLYDLLMNYLEDKGINNKFAEKMIELSTSYEHTAYISLLEGLSKFTSK